MIIYLKKVIFIMDDFRITKLELNQRINRCEIDIARSGEILNNVIKRLDSSNGKIDRIDERLEELIISYNNRPSWVISILIAFLFSLITGLIVHTLH